MQTNSRIELTDKLTIKPEASIVMVGKGIVAAIVGTIVAYAAITNVFAGVDIRNRLGCGQPAQEIRREMEREWGETA